MQACREDGVDESDVVAMAVKKNNLKLKTKKTAFKTVVQKVEVNVVPLQTAFAAIGRLADVTELTADEILHGMSLEQLAAFKLEILSGKSHMDVKMAAAYEYTPTGAAMKTTETILKESMSRYSYMVSETLSTRFDTVDNLVSAIDIVVGMRHGAAMQASVWSDMGHLQGGENGP